MVQGRVQNRKGNARLSFKIKQEVTKQRRQDRSQSIRLERPVNMFERRQCQKREQTRKDGHCDITKRQIPELESFRANFL